MQNYLAHHGIKGQKWYVRRFQNLDGSLTPAGKKRYGEWKPGKKTFRSETKAVIARASNEVKPFEVKPIDEEETAKRGLLDETENKKCISLAESIFSKASKVEPKITEDLIDSANKSGSKMYGLEYRLKQPTSLAAKIGADAKEKDLSFEEASKGIKDSVRYTVLSDTDHYVDNYNALKNELLEKGYSEVRFKNYFEKYRNGEVRHKAIQCTYQSPDGFDFEVQFHTPESQAVKELKIPLYEEIRKQGVSTERKERLEKEMQDLAERIPDPPGVYDIKHSDTLDDVLGDYLMHYGVSVDDGAPGPGSGRYPKGSGERPFQRDPEMLAKKKKGLFSGIKTALAKRKANTEIDRYRDYVDGMLNGSLKNNKALHDKYKELNDRTDGKEFDRGPFRYQYNVPDELSGKEADREKLAAEWKKFSEEVVDKHAKAEAKSEALNKAREAKAAKEEREAEKAKAIASGDPEQISKWLSEMSNQEQFDALNRIRQTKDIKSQAAAQVKAREDAAKAEEARRKAEEEAKRPKSKKELRDEKLKESFESAKDVMNKVDDVRQMAEKGIKFWNVIAAVNNATNEDFKLPKVDLNPGDKKKDKDKEENKEKDKNKNQQNNSGSTTNTNSNNTTYNTTNNYYNGEKKEDKPESETEAETWRPSGMEDWYDAPYKYEEAGKLLLEDFMKRKK